MSLTPRCFAELRSTHVCHAISNIIQRLLNFENMNNVGCVVFQVYHSFHDEVRMYKTHIWKCDGPCQNRKPFYGFVRRSMNRAPGPNDLWWADHAATCGGKFHKIKEPENFGKKKGKSSKKNDQGECTRHGRKKLLFSESSEYILCLSPTTSQSKSAKNEFITEDHRPSLLPPQITCLQLHTYVEF